jgi:hypothetical protein
MFVWKKFRKSRGIFKAEELASDFDSQAGVNDRPDTMKPTYWKEMT